ncbi:MAG TPA: hypothetical protein VLF93_06875 [Candidatus Saccharimonadales bacterium]|nr:hypothetical protein [Candidatus Saccharimonadales bacterium]
MNLTDRNPVSQEIKNLRRNRLDSLPHAGMVVVLSGNGTVEEHVQPGSDLHRINTGITAVRLIAAQKLNIDIKRVKPNDIRDAGVLFYYNGRTDDQNPAMRRFRESPDCPLPPDLFVIEQLPQDAQHTGGQAAVFAEYLSYNSSLKSVPKILITHEYHVPRVSRYPEFQQELEEGRLTFLPVRDQLRRRHKVRKGERERIVKYTNTGNLVEPSIADMPAFYLPRRTAKKWH